ncbi:ferric reductase-like transmembrane domain-containing protein [bacterium]|nr:ferric reductase-like transmembrane domain-containing protein [bacterium]
MLTTSRTRQNLLPVFLSVALTLALWLGSKWYFDDWFTNPLKYPAKAASLTALVLMCWCIFLSTRFRFLEDFFGGLDKVYQVHKRLGRWSFGIILMHPLLLAADQLPQPGAFFGYMWLRVPVGDPYFVGKNFGVIAMIVMAGLIAMTLWIRIPYHVWKRTHEWFGMVLLLVIIHIAWVSADIIAYPLLSIWMYSVLLLTMMAFIYTRFFYRSRGPRYAYVVAHIEYTGGIFELTLSPRGEKMDFKPSQFVYLVVHKPDIPPEFHPYSIASGYNLGGNFKLGIKEVGDHTRKLHLLEKGDQVTVYGPYGRFSEKFLSAERDCILIGGGIGITAFIGMWHVALHSEEQLDRHQVPEKLRSTHPEIIRTWKSPRVALYYVCRTPDQATFDEEIQREVILSQFHGFKAMEERGHHYELHISSVQGRFSARHVVENVTGGVLDRNIFLCGPIPMVRSLIEQFHDLGIPDEQIIVEDFNLI